jgi:uncharacterized membrane protein
VNNWKVIFATAVIFGAGVVTGGLLVNYVERAHPRNPRHWESSGSTTNSGSQTNNQTPSAPRLTRLPEILNKQFLQRLDEELHLTPEQREAVQKIITEGQNQMHKTIQDARLEIREQLLPEQRSLFDELVKRPPHRASNATNSPANGPASPAKTPGA